MNKLVYDIGGSNIKFAVMTDAGEIVSRSSVSTPRDSLEHFLGVLCELASAELGQADGAAVSTNGRMTPDGETYRAYTMDFLVGVNLREELERRLGLPVSVENDGLAATLGEWWKGAAQGEEQVLGVVLGTGMGAGLILDGKPRRGARRNGAMIFGVLSEADPEKETYLASGIATAFPVVLYQAAAMKGLDPRSLAGPQLFQWAAEGDPVACGLLEQYYRSIAVAIFNTAVFLDVGCVVLTGGLAAQEQLVEGVRRNLRAISEKAFTFHGMDISQLGIRLDPEDFSIDLRAGSLKLDANLYGALYHFLEEHP